MQEIPESITENFKKEHKKEKKENIDSYLEAREPLVEVGNVFYLHLMKPVYILVCFDTKNLKILVSTNIILKNLCHLYF